MGFMPRTPSFTNLSSVDAPDPLTGHSYLLHTLNAFVGTRGLTFVQNVPLPSTQYSDSLSSSLCNLMGRCPIHLLPLAKGARGSPCIYPAHRIRLDRRPRRIQSYRMCSIHIGLWCWDAPTEVAHDDAPSQRWGWRGVFSFCFEVGVRQGSVTFPINPYGESVRLTAGQVIFSGSHLVDSPGNELAQAHARPGRQGGRV